MCTYLTPPAGCFASMLICHLDGEFEVWHVCFKCLSSQLYSVALRSIFSVVGSVFVVRVVALVFVGWVVSMGVGGLTGKPYCFWW